MVSGSASLPTTLRDDWRKLSGGQVLLERYGMTGKFSDGNTSFVTSSNKNRHLFFLKKEIGMGLSQEYLISERVQGTVGIPLPGVQARIIAEDGKDVTESRNVPGMLQIKGPNVFKEYWQKPEATKKEFTEDGW
jgi:acyl-CoA synthetase (AMP-forming)/AMP-acid ligase II